METQTWSEDRAKAVISAFSGVEGATLPILHALQAEFGCVPAGTVPLVADALNLSRAEVHGIVTFYHDFRAEPPGRIVLKLCRAEACQARGAEALAEHAKQRLGVEWHGTTANGAVTLEPVFCLGLCATAPAALLGDEPVARLDAETLDDLLAECR